MSRLLFAVMFALASQAAWPQAAMVESLDYQLRRGELRNQLDEARARRDWNAAASLQAELAAMGGRPAPGYVTHQPAYTSHQIHVNGRILNCNTCGQQTQCV